MKSPYPPSICVLGCLVLISSAASAFSPPPSQNQFRDNGIYATDGTLPTGAESCELLTDTDCLDEYAPLLTQQFGAFDWTIPNAFRAHLPSGASVSGTGQWATDVTNATTDIYWGLPQSWPPDYHEEMELRKKCFDGQSWFYLNSYHSTLTLTCPGKSREERRNFENPVVATKVIYSDSLNTNVDVTHVGQCGTRGHPYVRRNIWGQPYEITVWGNVMYDNPCDDQPPSATKVAGRFFWKARWTPPYGNPVANQCWTGTGPKARPAVLLEEAYWQKNDCGIDPKNCQGIWHWGTGAISAKTSEPTGNVSQYGRRIWIGKNAGYNWNYEERFGAGVASRGATACLVQSADWRDAN